MQDEQSKKDEKQKGRTNNPNGRPKGSTNKATTELKDAIKSFLSDNQDKFSTEFGKLEGEDYVKNYIALLKYSIPTLQSTKEEIDFNDLSEAQMDYLLEALKSGKKPLKSEIMAIKSNDAA